MCIRDSARSCIPPMSRIVTIRDVQPTAICGVIIFCITVTIAMTKAIPDVTAPASETRRKGATEKLVAICSHREMDFLRL